jgi:hypothetical protein
MKKFLVALFSAAMLSGFTGAPVLKSGINGIVDPVEGARKIWAINGNDSVSTLPQAGGKFAMDVKPGSYTVIIRAAAPFKDVSLANVLVYENQSTDVGVITLREGNK